MTQKSYPWPGVSPGSGADAGRYLNTEWTAVWSAIARSGGMVITSPLLRTLASLTNIGVFYSVGNGLEVTNPGAAANTIQVDTGASLVEGQFCYNDAAVTITVPSSRTNDLIVVRRNFTASTYTPPSSTDSDEQVPPYTSRISRVTSLVQDTSRATYWDIPLADFSTDGAGAVTINSDDREWVDAETKRFLVSALVGHNVTDVSEIVPTSGTITSPLYIGPRLVFPDNKECYGLGRFCVPSDFISTMTSEAIITTVAGGGGNIYGDNRYQAGECSQDPHTHSGGTGFSAVAITGPYDYNCIQNLSIANVGVSDIVQLIYYRDGVDALDTMGASAYLPAWIVEYLGWR